MTVSFFLRLGRRGWPPHPFLIIAIDAERFCGQVSQPAPVGTHTFQGAGNTATPSVRHGNDRTERLGLDWRCCPCWLREIRAPQRSPGSSRDGMRLQRSLRISRPRSSRQTGFGDSQPRETPSSGGTKVATRRQRAQRTRALLKCFCE